MNRPLLGVALFVGLVWVLAMAMALSFSGLFARDADFCHERVMLHEWLFPARLIVCLMADPTAREPAPGEGAPSDVPPRGEAPAGS